MNGGGSQGPPQLLFAQKVSSSPLVAVPRLSRMDGWLLLATFVWGSNYGVVKFVLRELPPHGFNLLRLALASLVFLVMIWLHPRPRGGSRSFSLQDVGLLVLLAVVGQFLYQTLFIEGLARTSAANASLILATTPVAVTLTSAALGHERVGWLHWLGTALSVAGVWLVVGHGDGGAGASLAGDLLMIAATLCWTVYTVAARPLLARHPPVVVTGYSMAMGTVLYLVHRSTVLVATPWHEIGDMTWIAVIFSSVLALNFSYTVWYTAVQRLGAPRTSIYANMVPIAALVVAGLWLGEPIGWLKLTGAGLVIGGVAFTRA
ncbi:MAG: EamA family transporter [Luteitalea sp.]|nr:EamA family transporter [Luteitalea sp.]